jgi:FG-GAP repeat
MTQTRGAALLAILVVASVTTLLAAHTLNSKQRAVVEFWLKHHPDYRLATDADCNCADNIQVIRRGSGGLWKPVPDYHPYVVSGDFNGDGKTDIAVTVVSRSTHKYGLLMFNGPFDSQDVAPAFFDKDSGLAGDPLFYGPPRPKPYRLVIGPFESEGAIVEPHGSTYGYSRPEQ